MTTPTHKSRIQLADEQAQPADLNVISRDQHNVSRQNISKGCLKVLYRLNEAGFQSYVVGGGVRDLLLDLNPKDFDVATDATPEQVNELFRNSRIIGRRFRIVHVRFGREIIEVSTFRAKPEDPVQVSGESLGRKVKNVDSARSSSGMLLRDNVYGDIEGDVQRRDFTVNALYYTVNNFEIHDYVQGIKDLENRTLRIIGNPEQRYQEDPVRVLRAIRLSVKLNFEIDPLTAAPIREYALMLESIPAARLFDECLKLFFSGFAKPTYDALEQYGVFSLLFPQTSKNLLADEHGQSFLQLAMENTDQRLSVGKSVAPYFLFATILWPAVNAKFQRLLEKGLPEQIAMSEAGDEVLKAQVSRIAIPKRFSIPMREIWEMQLRLPKRRGKKANSLLSHRRFRAAYDFLLLREEAHYIPAGLGSWWTEYQHAEPEKQGQMQSSLEQSMSKKNRLKAKPSNKKKHLPN